MTTTNFILPLSEVESFKGYLVTRNGKIPVNKDGDGTQTTLFFAIVERYRTGELSVGRALKNAKKGMAIIEL